MLSSKSSSGRFFSWCLILGSAALCADICTASIDRYLTEDPASVVIPVNSSGSRNYSRLSSRKDVETAFRQPAAPKPKVKPASRKRSVSLGGRLEEKKSKKRSEAPKEDIKIDKAVLKGTLISGSHKAALLELEPGKTVVVGLGEELGDYILEEVDYAWARFVSDTEEMLFIADSMSDSGGDSKNSGPIVKKLPVPEEEDAEDSEKDEDGSEDEESEEKESASEDRVTSADIKAALDNSAEMAKQLRVVPEERDGVPYGTRISFRTKDNLLSKMGVNDRDIMLSINGVPTRSAEEMFRGYMTLRNASSFEFVLERNGKEQTIHYELGK